MLIHCTLVLAPYNSDEYFWIIRLYRYYEFDIVDSDIGLNIVPIPDATVDIVGVTGKTYNLHTWHLLLLYLVVNNDRDHFVNFCIARTSRTPLHSY